MGKHQKVNIFVTAAICAMVHGAMALIFVPVISITMLAVGVAPAPFAGWFANGNGMLLAAGAPVIWALIGFAAGGSVAFLYNLSGIDATKDEIPIAKLRTVMRAAAQAA